MASNDAIEREEARQWAAHLARQAARLARKKWHKLCGAKTRKGTPCQARGLGRGNRCKFHGGMSTGPRTPEGRQRCREAALQRWEKVRAAREART